MIQRRNHGSGHSYWEVDGVTGVEVKVPGVTTILSDSLPKGGLVSWAATKAAEYAVDHWSELAELSVLKRAQLIRDAPRTERDAAAGRGTQIHRLAEQLTHGQEVDVPEALAGHVEACVEFLDRWEVEPVLSEAVVINRAVPYAGTLDLIADIRGQRWLLDWKTSGSIRGESALQLAAYRYAEHYLGPDHAEHAMADLAIQRTGIVHLRADGFDLYPMAADREAFLLFRHVAYVARWTRWDKDARSTRMDSLKGAAL